jgi:drug/metabolite transporter (DMT)-like permease
LKPSQGIIYALFASLFQSGVNVSIVKMKEEHALVNSFYSMGMTTLLSLCWWKSIRSSIVFYLTFGNIRTSIFMYSMGFISLLAQSLRTSALQISNSLPLTVFRYLDIPLAFLWDSVIFHYIFSIYEIIGISIILFALILKLFI